MIWSPVGGGQLLTGDDARTKKIRDLLTAHRQATTVSTGRPKRRSRLSRAIRSKRVPIVGSGKRERVSMARSRRSTRVMDRQDWYAVVTETSPMLEL